MNATALLRALLTVADDVGPVAAPADLRSQLHAICRTARLATGAVAASIARVNGDELVYEASDGPGAEQIIGLRLPLTRGIAGLVALTGQAMVIDRVQSNPRFARDVAERTGYMPETMVVVPITPQIGDVVGVLSILDRGSAATAGGADVLALASSLAELAAPVLPAIDSLVRLAPLLLQALADAVAANTDLAVALRREATRRQTAGPGEGTDLSRLVALLATARALGPETTEAAERLLDEFLSFAGRKRRR